MTNYLGIDFGLKHLGFALAESVLATPLGSYDYQHFDDALTFVMRLIEEHHIDIIVLGLPEGKIALSVKNFGQRLREKVAHPIIYHPETLSTHEAKTSLLATGSRAKRQNDHTYAACLILEDYLDMLN